MSVIIETSLGEIVIDLHVKECPKTCLNFLKLCKTKYYNNCIFHNVQKDLLVQTGDPTWTGKGGESIYASLYGEQARYFEGEPREHLTHSKAGTVSMAISGKLGEKSLHGSQFFITTQDDKDHLDGSYTVFGKVAEGLDIVMQINDAYVDDKGRPYRNIRIKHVVVLDDPFPDPEGLQVPSESPRYVPKDHRKEADDKMLSEQQEGKTDQEIEEEIAAQEAFSRAKVLEMVGDIHDAEAKPPDEVLFVCKLNQVTVEDDLEVLFSRFGPVKKCEIIRDSKTGQSLCYGFVEFENKESCVEAYTKMDNVLIDERRIHVDFCQSVAKIWRNRVFGVPLPDSASILKKKKRRSRSKERRKRSRSRSRDRRRRSRSRDRDRRKGSKSRDNDRKRSRSRERKRK